MYYIQFCEYCLKLLNSKKITEVLVNFAKEYKENDFKYNFYIKEVILKLVNENDEDDKKDIEKEQKVKEYMDEEDI